ncbi:phosphoprotein associated with glycosphingolipid-enriched microdomains 1 [Syngnathus scovelli]|uniref:phosphoprotein associated with glycosphingolipid-enriched microdomains 1 n=1 Tax=Syngnathus scovelli TaxID=161590 RepID=UPI0021106863|nr:phosphoprotein associated with glycosphingolipid-enriched microdomains 1 [Syngnathus scovelli]XP_049607051.1 phosphoprotein associated with glycosphingolipid-enriched microdomains 1 [Syngnathus scovelli]XP_049607053.1 phosphoprotein associated with glycosphingolipid-enriched microdomains 1 [Syngnathus scovelli]XP_049607054.1 phosphoprotein associated with glycosphingolipid-enriched microdomains 1 [Syngnathus scovelli]
MAPLLSSVWWEPEAAVVGAGGQAVTWLGGGGAQLAPPVALSTLVALLLVSVLLLLCAGCREPKKAAVGHPAGNRVDLMDAVSDKEMVSRLADSPVTDVCVSSSHDGPLTCGTILTDTQASSPQASEEITSSQLERRSSKCPQGRQLPSIPPSSPLLRHAAPPTSGDSTYEVVNDMSTASRDVSVEDSLYETVKELKEPPKKLGLPNGTVGPSPANTPPPPPLLNGHAGSPSGSPGAHEYASVDRNKKSRYSADLEAKRRSQGAGVPSPRLKEEPEDFPPPLPEKFMDENENRHMLMNGHVGAEPHNGKSGEHSNVEPMTAQDISASHDYSSIGELKGLIVAGPSGDLYASVMDVYARPVGGTARDGGDPGYESIHMPDTGCSDEERPGVDGSEPDYESVGDSGPSRL